MFFEDDSAIRGMREGDKLTDWRGDPPDATAFGNEPPDDWPAELNTKQQPPGHLSFSKALRVHPATQCHNLPFLKYQACEHYYYKPYPPFMEFVNRLLWNQKQELKKRIAFEMDKHFTDEHHIIDIHLRTGNGEGNIYKE